MRVCVCVCVYVYVCVCVCERAGGCAGMIEKQRRRSERQDRQTVTIHVYPR
jgi:hypothetical protein